MRFLADEDFPKPLVTLLKKLGHSVKTIQQKGLRGVSDQTVGDIAIKESRIVLTFDKDFLKIKSPRLRVVLFQFSKTPTIEIILLIKDFLKDLQKLNIAKVNTLTFSKRGLKINVDSY